MTISAKYGVKELVAAAEKEIESVPIHEALDLLGRNDVVFVDVRDVRELERDGQIPGAMHVPRGMLEFWVDPNSPYHKELFDEDKRFIFYCAADWRGVLVTATAKGMGLENAYQLSGGLGAWRSAGGAVEAFAPKKKDP